MTDSAPPSNPTSSPIINSPYDAPTWHWSLDMEFRACEPALAGRRPSGAYLSVPKPQRRQGALDLTSGHRSSQQIEPHRQINQIRAAVEAWREAGYPGARAATMALIEHWSNPDTDGLQPYFCQRDAVETAIFLAEAPEAAHRPFNERLEKLNVAHNDGIARIALKLATGTGKTLVMAMLMLWQAKNGYCRDFVVFVPNLTIRDRLAEVESGSEIYDRLRPKGDRTRFRVTVINFQAWQARSGVGIEGTMTREQMRAMVLDAERYSHATTETEDEMIDRLLAAHRGHGGVCVFNDEAHHCYNGERAGGSRIESESKPEEARAMMWFGALQALQRRSRLAQVFDLSATPMWLRKPTVKEPSVLFPWTVSDYPLVDAIEAGLVKIPRVPIRDESGADVPAFRNLHTTVKETLGKADLPPKEQPLPHTMEDALARMIADYERTCAHYKAKGVKPILIVVADTIRNAERLFAHLGGWRRNSMWVGGRFGILSNIDAAGRVKPAPPTLLVHSRMDETDKDATLAGKVESSDNAAIHVQDETVKAPQRMDIIRRLFNTAGQPGQPGERLRCIVSVGMLTEGWDARTVTHVVGYRSFGSDLLCEQVAGRALRRSVGLEPGAKLATEYANIIGIPFRYMQATERGDPGESKERWMVHTVPGRADRRIELPRIRGWRRDRPGPKAKLKTPLGPIPALSHTQGTGAVDLGGEVGVEVALTEDRREQPALWRLAEQVRIRCRADHGDDASMNRIESFASVVRETERYLKLRALRASRLKTEGDIQAVSADVAKHLRWGEADDRIVATMGDPSHVSTGDLHFETTLLRYPNDRSAFPERTELNAAACHSEFERHVAALLDQVPGVDAWTRNFRLDWSIPWYDPLHARWHDYEPDFVARVTRDNGAGGYGHLVIEVKGERDLRSEEKMRAALTWCERVSNGASGESTGPWQYTLIEDYENAGVALGTAVNALRAR